MPNQNFDEPPESDEWCGEEIESNPGMYCSNKAKFSDGKCGLHSDEYEKHTKGGRWKHGAYADRSMYYQKLSDEEKNWVDAVYNSFIEEAPFDEEATGKCEMVWNVAIDLSKQRQINEYISKEGVHQERFAGAGDSEAFYEDEENPLHLTYDRLSRSNVKVLKELNILDSPDSKAADARQSFVELFKDNIEDSE